MYDSVHLITTHRVSYKTSETAGVVGLHLNVVQEIKGSGNYFIYLHDSEFMHDKIQ